MTRHWIVDTQVGYHDEEVHLVIVYELYGGCPGDHLTPPDPPTVEIEDGFYLISRKRQPDVRVPVFDLHWEALDMDGIKSDIYNHHFPY